MRNCHIWEGWEGGDGRPVPQGKEDFNPCGYNENQLRNFHPTYIFLGELDLMSLHFCFPDRDVGNSEMSEKL